MNSKIKKFVNLHEGNEIKKYIDQHRGDKNYIYVYFVSFIKGYFRYENDYCKVLFSCKNLNNVCLNDCENLDDILEHDIDTFRIKK